MEKEEQHFHADNHCCDHHPKEADAHEHSHGQSSASPYLAPAASLSLLLSALGFDFFQVSFFEGNIRVAWYLLAYLPVAFPVVKMAFKTIQIGDIFTEFLLMSLATIGALALGEYAEAVAVMLFYTLGELFQEAAVNRAKRNISALLDVRPNIAHVFRGGKFVRVKPEEVLLGETVQLKVGEKAPVDGLMLSESSSFNTAALTGESVPRTIHKNEQVLSGMLNLTTVVNMQVTHLFKDSALSRILELIQSATSKKAKTELFIRKFAKIYTPIVFFLALGLVVIPYFFVNEYHFQTWLYRALVFLVISCPCALVISIPLGYFGGIGAASANGILFKGSNFLDLLTKLNKVVFDKTGTLTRGVFKVERYESSIDDAQFKSLLATIESQSTHPVAKAIVSSFEGVNKLAISDVQEVAGHGLSAKIENQEVVAGNAKLMKRSEIDFPSDLGKGADTIVLLAVNRKFVGYVTLADELKPDAKATVDQLKERGIEVHLLSGDRSSIVEKTGSYLGVDSASGDLLPEDKVQRMENIKNTPKSVVAFVGDGINDAPVLALSDIGIAMGAMGSDLAIETAAVVIQNDKLGSIIVAIQIANATKKVVYQNIGLAFVVKAIVLLLGAGGLATMWEAVFADVGVALLAILNAVRIQRMNFKSK